MPAAPELARAVEILEVERPAMVLGSTQPDSIVDRAACDASGVEVARRQSGGGVVFVDNADLLWVDVLLPVNDPLWTDDVSASSRWLAGAWVAALERGAGMTNATIHDGSMCLNRWGRLVCFAGLGPGEVTAGAGGPKIVGISQRRTRSGARFQCALPLRWTPERFLPLLWWPDASEQRDALADLTGPGAVLPVEPARRDAVLDAFLEALGGAAP